MADSVLPRPCGTSCTNMPGLPVSRPDTSEAMSCATPMPAGSSSWGYRRKVIGDILGHRRAQSTSAYLRVATERLREVALALPA